MGEIDANYHNIFSIPQMMADFLKNVVKPAWLDQYDLDSLSLIDSKHYSDQLIARPSDVIYSLRKKHSDKIIFLVLLLEFQSTQD